MQLTFFNIEGFDYLSEIASVELVELAEKTGAPRHYEMIITRADTAEFPWLGGYAVRPEFVVRLELGGQRASGRWRRTRYDGTTAVFVSVGDIEFAEARVLP